MKKLENEKYYNEFSKKYNNKRRAGSYLDYINKTEISIIEPFIKKKKILEVGCGTGLILQETQKKALEAIGIDISEKMLDLAKKNKLYVKKANATSIPFPDNYFDVVYSFKVLPHIENIDLAIREMRRVTKKEGYLILEFYNPYSIKKITDTISGNNVYTRYDSIKKIKKMTKKHNIEIRKIYGIKIIILELFSKIRIIKKIFLFLDKKLSLSMFKYFAGYIIIIAKNNE
ncbi:MAG: class I SAM-dependent methyltransferase [Candidatus Pacebacteria bacterium]|nr:class I SAM-dependent methyltransferase [Candidatus Paceibacterota bacterium]